MSTKSLAPLWGVPFLLLAFGEESSAQCIQQRHDSASGAAGNLYGAAVDVEFGFPTRLAIGSPRAGTDAGQVEVYQVNGTGLSLLDTVTDGSSNNQFGSAVGITTEYMIVGAPFDGFSNAGKATIHKRNGSQYPLLVTLNPSGPTQVFGSAVSMGPFTAVASSPSVNSNNGRVHVFDRDAGGFDMWGEVQIINGTANGFFGTSVSLSGNTLVVGAPLEDEPGLSDNGAAYVYERIGTTWVQAARLLHPNPSSTDIFGWSVAAFGTRVVVGCPQDDTAGNNAGAAFVFDRDEGGAGNWGLQATLIDGCPNSRMGESVAMSDSWVVAGAPDGCGAGNISTGSAHIFDRDEGGYNNWGFAYEALATGGQFDDDFGAAVAVTPGVAIIGAPRDDNSNGNNAGSVYLNNHDSCISISTYCYCPFGAPGCSNPDDDGGCANQTGEGASLTYTGTADTAADDLVINISDVPPNQLGIIFYGPTSVGIPLGNGIRCVGGQIIRFPFQTSTPAGTMQEGPGIVNFSQGIPNGMITPGSTWNFQAWFRDPNGPCGGTTNLSNALRVDFF